MKARAQHIVEFIRSSFPSIWSIELLLHLKQSPWAAFPTAQLVAELRASEAIVSTSIDSLLAAGLIVEEGEQSYRYAPASEDLAKLVADSEELYRKQPNVVRRVIVLGTGNLAAFADAFKIRKD